MTQYTLNSFRMVIRGASVIGFSVCSLFSVCPIYSNIQMSISQLFEELQSWNSEFCVMCSILKTNKTLIFSEENLHYIGQLDLSSISNKGTSVSTFYVLLCISYISCSCIPKRESLKLAPTTCYFICWQVLFVNSVITVKPVIVNIVLLRVFQNIEIWPIYFVNLENEIF